MTIDVFDFFSGCGGASCGFKSAGMNIKMGLDIDSVSSKTFKENFPEAEFILDDIRNVNVDRLKKIMDRTSKVLFSGCAPCQPFSRQNRQKENNDVRLNLLDEFSRFVKYYMPDYVFVENVPGMQIQAQRSQTFYNFQMMLKEMGYFYTFKVVDSKSYGVPQKRTRLILLASKNKEIDFPEATHGEGKKPFSTVREWIYGLPELAAGETSKTDNDHFACKLSNINIERIRSTPEGGGRESWPSHLILPCHKQYNGHSDVYGRLSWDKTASGLTTRCTSYSNGRFGHPEQDRAISLREAACLQTFPREFKFCGSKVDKARQVGNAVPPLLAKNLAIAFIRERK